jgi:uncharacterized iron-regulated membrane protein
MFFEHDKYFVSHPDKLLLNMEDLIAKVEQNIDGKVVIASMSDHCRDKSAFFMLRIKKESIETTRDKHNNRYESYQIDAYSSKTLGKTSSLLTKFFNIVSKLHSLLLLPYPIGRIIVGSATLIFVIVVLSGFCLWLPANFRNKKAWTNALLFRFRKRKKQLIYDLHKTLGFYVLIPTLLMAFTGLTWSFQWYNNGIKMIFLSAIKLLRYFFRFILATFSDYQQKPFTSSPASSQQHYQSPVL